MPIAVKKSGPGLSNVAKQIRELTQTDVLVGIPAATAMRPGQEMNNASLLFLLEEGSPLHKMPPRPVLDPSIKISKKVFTPHLGLAAKAVLENRPDDARKELNLAGTIAANGAKRYILVGSNLAPNAPSTIAAKGSDRPLVNQGLLVKSLTHVLRRNGVESPPAESLGTAVEEVETAVEETGGVL